MLVEFQEFWTYLIDYSAGDFMNSGKGLSSENGLSDLRSLYHPPENFDGTSNELFPSLAIPVSWELYPKKP